MNLIRLDNFWLIFEFLLICLMSDLIPSYGMSSRKEKPNFLFSSGEWTCRDNKCVKSNSLDNSPTISLETCKMMCPSDLPLWPKPKFIETINKNSTTFIKNYLFLKIFSSNKIKKMLEKAANIFLGNLIGPSKNYQLIDGEEQILKLQLYVDNDIGKLYSYTNESYHLICRKTDGVIWVTISAPTYFGVRHGLETLSQLVWYDSFAKKFRIIHDIEIIDEPKFTHRGILIDVSRNFFPISMLKKAIDGMAASKLNVLHLHVSDSESFPLVLPNNKLFARNGAYHVNMIYTPNDIKSLISYASVRGIRISLEVDAPSHVHPDVWPAEETVCGDESVFRATLNPDNNKTFDTLQRIYKDLLELGTDNDTFHIGNDEVVLDCWKNTKAAQGERDLHILWAKFTNKMIESVKLANNGSIPKNLVLWSSPLTDYYISYLDHKDELVVQYWFGIFDHLLHSGYKIIFSTVGQWYLDCGFGPWRKHQLTGSCDPYTHWLKFYKYRPWNDYPDKINQVLGGEVCLWTEQVSPDDMETRLWPRSAAFAERLWSDPEYFVQDDVFRRLDGYSLILKRRGIKVAAIWPMYCSFYPEKC